MGGCEIGEEEHKNGSFMCLTLPIMLLVGAL